LTGAANLTAHPGVARCALVLTHVGVRSHAGSLAPSDPLVSFAARQLNAAG
jgi:hypothetical protein